MHLARLFRCTTLAVAAALLAGRASAQATTPPTDPAVVVIPQNIAGINPIGLIPGLFSAEFEHVVMPGSGFTVGVGGSYEAVLGQHDYDVQSSWIDAKAKYYPREEGFAGFSVGLTAGLLRSHGAKDDDPVNPIQHKAAGTLGVALDYNWMLGKRKRLYAGTGIGAKRVFGPTGGNSILDPVFGYGRLQLGLTF